MKKIALLVSLAFLTLVSAQKECSSTVYKDLGNLAKRSPTYFQDPVPLCDRYLVKGWYVAFHHDMPTSPPSLTACGTTYPNWLNDSLPETHGASKAVKICEVGFASACSRSHFVQVTNCGAFFVYELTPLDICSSAYCFQADKVCVTDVPSNVLVAYHGVTWETSIVGVTTIHEPDVNLVCQFDRLPDQSLYYDVTWYVDDTEVLTNQTVSSNSSDLALLTGSQMLAKGKKATSMIHCIVGAKISQTDIPCKTTVSALFFAGIKVLDSILRIPRGKHRDVKIQFTIPFVSQHGVINITGKLTEQQPLLFISLGVHGGSVDCDDPNKRNCDTKVSAFKKQDTYMYATDEWKKIISIRVYNKDDGDYILIDKHITLRLETGATNGKGSKIFENIILPDIQVYVEDTNSVWKGVNCESHTDPHMKTFDGKEYECQLDGTFVLYRNTHFEQEKKECSDGFLIISQRRCNKILSDIALRRPTKQSSTLYTYTAEYAVDGYYGTDLINNECTSTDTNDINPWWMVDLQTVCFITSVRIVNRGPDNSGIDSSHRLRDVTVTVGLSESTVNIVCGFFAGPGTLSQVVIIDCPTIPEGRFVKVSKTTDYLTLCEVDVFGVAL